jgi:orotate phosphoribosyltransferase
MSVSKGVSYARDETSELELHGDDYGVVLRGIASNVKYGPFKATSGVTLEYYLNLATNFLDTLLASKIATMYARELHANFRSLELPAGQEKLLCVGMEMAGGILSAQLACQSVDGRLSEWMDFIYMRKERKATGTAQQLEGPQRYTRRTRDSPRISAVWVDDALSTGSSLKQGASVLLADFNIEIVAALYLVDRSIDRAGHSEMSVPFRTVACYDLEQVHQEVQRSRRGSSIE